MDPDETGAEVETEAAEVVGVAEDEEEGAALEEAGTEDERALLDTVEEAEATFEVEAADEAAEVTAEVDEEEVEPDEPPMISSSDFVE